MLAVNLRARGVSGVSVCDVNKPELLSGHCLVKMRAASVNRVDLFMRDDGVGITHTLPQIMGVDGVGVIATSGPGSAFSPGENVIIYPYEFCGTCRFCIAGDQPLCENARILGEHRDGTFCEYVSVPEESLVRLSANANIEAAAALGVAYLTAWRMVFGKVTLSPGGSVLVQGGGGGVSLAAAQLAAMAGHRVIVTTTGAEKLETLSALGWEVIDYATNDTSRAVLAMTNGAGVDLVIDNVGDKTWNQSLRSLRRGGHLVTCGATTGAQPGVDIQRMFVRQLTVHGSTMGSMSEFRQLVACFEAGRFTPWVDSTYPLARTGEALNRLSAPERLGKIVIQISEANGVKESDPA